MSCSEARDKDLCHKNLNLLSTLIDFKVLTVKAVINFHQKLAYWNAEECGKGYRNASTKAH